MINTSSKGGSKLASVLQQRVANVSKNNKSILVETGEIVSGGKLRLSSQPDKTIEKKDFSICIDAGRGDYKVKAGQKVLVVWTLDGEPVVVARIIKANKA